MEGVGGEEGLWAGMLALLDQQAVDRLLVDDGALETLDADMDADMDAFALLFGATAEHGSINDRETGSTLDDGGRGGDNALEDRARRSAGYMKSFGSSQRQETADFPGVFTSHSKPEPVALSLADAAMHSTTMSSAWPEDQASTNASSMIPQGETKAASAMEVRRTRNREFMRRARQRHREDLKSIKATVESLERQYADLCLRAKEMAGGARSISVPSSPASPSSMLSAQRRHVKKQQQQQLERQQHTQAQLRYAEVTATITRLGAENLYLRAAIQDKSAWNRNMRRIFETAPAYVVGDEMGMLGPPQRMPARMASLPVDILDPDAAHSIFGFFPLTETDVSALMLDNSHQMHYRVTQTSIMEFMFTKRFSGLSASDIMHKTWANDMDLEKFKKVKTDVKRLEVLQIANVNAYILGRDILAPDKNVVFRSVFLRYLIETSQTLPNPKNNSRVFGGSDNESEDKDVQPLKASGFILGTHSVNRDWSKSGDTGSNVPKLLPMESLDGSNHETLMWADLALSIEFLDVEDPTTGETFQRVRWIGRTDYKTPADALRNTVDMLSGCLRWELLMISPALNLVSLKL